MQNPSIKEASMTIEPKTLLLGDKAANDNVNRNTSCAKSVFSALLMCYRYSSVLSCFCCYYAANITV